MSSRAATINGVDLAAIGEFAQQLAADPNADKSAWSARTTWTGAFTSSSYAREHGPIRSDEPELLAGGNSAPNPVEYVLTALGSCLAVGYAAAGDPRDRAALARDRAVGDDRPARVPRPRRRARRLRADRGHRPRRQRRRRRRAPAAA